MTATEAAFALIGSSLTDLDNVLAQAARALGVQWASDGETYVEVHSLGFSLVLNENMKISCVQLYADGLDGYSAFPFEFHTLTMQSSSGTVFSVLGTPQERSMNWAAYINAGIRVHFEFSDEEGIRIITLTDKQWVPGDR